MDRKKDVVSTNKPGNILFLSQEKDVFYFNCSANINLEISILSTDIFKFRYLENTNKRTDFSYALLDNFQSEEALVSAKETSSYFEIKTNTISCKVYKEDCSVSLFNSEGVPISEDHKFSSKKSILKGIIRQKINRKCYPNEEFYGLGDKSCSLDLKGKKLVNWNTDSFAFESDTDPLYRSIPFYYSLNNGIAHGIFLDSSYKTKFNFDKKSEGKSSFSADGGNLTYYFLYGPSFEKVAQSYSRLTGTCSLPALWTLGYHQCRWSYYPESRVKEIANEFRDRQIPCDAIYLDIDYMDAYKCFTWNSSYFPEPSKMVAELKEMGFKTIVMIDPGIKSEEGYSVYEEAVEKSMFCLRPDGELFQAPVWPPDCSFPDFTNPVVRNWWGKLYRELILENGIAGVWNDMNEPAIFELERKTFPNDIRHHYEGENCSHKKAHNIYGMQMSRATQEGLLKLQKNIRPFVLTRATYSGGQRYAAVWTGDNKATWEHLQIANRQCQRLSISGFSFCGTDIGGFVDTPSGELYARWIQLGIFHPLFRTHTMGFNLDGAAAVNEEEIAARAKTITSDQEPWSYGPTVEQIAKSAIELRYQLLAYIYTSFYQHCKSGKPIIQPLRFAFQTDKNTKARENEFLFGDDLLIAPITEEGANEWEVYLPEGNWYNLENGNAISGKQFIKFPVELSSIPIFAKAGSCLAILPIQQFVGELIIEEVELHLFYKSGTYSSTLYLDEGNGFSYRKGNFSLRFFEQNSTASKLNLVQSTKGNYKSDLKYYRIKIIGMAFTASSIICEGRKISFEQNESTIRLKIPSNFEEINIM